MLVWICCYLECPLSQVESYSMACPVQYMNIEHITMNTITVAVKEELNSRC